MKNIQILLSTYNGEDYLREQLDSFLKLSNYSDIKVLIRDDGSSDSTPLILKEYQENFGFEVIYGENIGLNKSLFTLMQSADKDCSYFAFADQDDVWLEDKLARGAEVLSGRDGNEPWLYAASSYLTDENLNVTGQTLIPKRCDFYNAMVQNVCVGHTQMINRALLLLLTRRFSPDIKIIDYWTYMLASGIGNVYYDTTPTTLYRQHSSNVIGYSNSFYKNLKKRLKRAKSDEPAKNTLQLVAFLDIYKDKIKKCYLDEAEKFLKKQKNFFTRLSYIFTAKAKRQTLLETLIFKIMYLFARYKYKTQKETIQ